jgi:hypothetical protein
MSEYRIEKERSLESNLGGSWKIPGFDVRENTVDRDDSESGIS